MRAIRSLSNGAATLILLVISVALNFVMVYRLRQAEADKRPTIQALKAGTAVPAITTQEPSGKTTVISFDTATILYIFRPDCPWCTLNTKSVNALAKQVEGKYRVIGLSLSDNDLNEYLTANPLMFPTYVGVTSEVAKTYKMGSTPQTIVVSKGGRVVASWNGAFVDRIKSSLERELDATLPSLEVKTQNRLPEASDSRVQ